jgi:hypothetical protein
MLTLTFDRHGYIEHPYWPEMAQVIEIEKRSGIMGYGRFTVTGDVGLRK